MKGIGVVAPAEHQVLTYLPCFRLTVIIQVQPAALLAREAERPRRLLMGCPIGRDDFLCKHAHLLFVPLDRFDAKSDAGQVVDSGFS